ncbi:hypothetical protein I547_1609 [Mycobacterium kansasii 824]|uniref:Uncharacterized protein n=1 Tax=Mycobacterium kansasii TaxID=1768 RepID=A0A1V3WFI8_MYCKA|nr:hypothetical protein I547_1609 [Mycobacterium kansasii 824]OOK65685.1 hypothetical protein BZL30_8681 [Mycobacterium kansasii]
MAHRHAHNDDQACRSTGEHPTVSDQHRSGRIGFTPDQY